MSEPSISSTPSWPTNTLFDNQEFLDQLVYLLIYDREVLEHCSRLLDDSDFKPLSAMTWGRPRVFFADRALDHYKKYDKPGEKMLLTDVLEYGRRLGCGHKQLQEIKDYWIHLKNMPIPGIDPAYPNQIPPGHRQWIIDSVRNFKEGRLIAEYAGKLVENHGSRGLTIEEIESHFNELKERFYKPDSLEVAGWPAPLEEAAFQGLAGEIVRVIEPHSEADPAALLVQLLICFGNVIGRRAHFIVESDHHYMNLYAVIVGTTAKARKGTSFGRILGIFKGVDSEWYMQRRHSGLSSGEGLINAVRNPMFNKAMDEIIDAGVEDKRLMIHEPEFARVLQVCERETNTLSAIIREAWDNGNLNILTRNNALKATNAHVSIVGHITREELLKRLKDTAQANGFANRFLWICARRSKALPRGGNLDPSRLHPFIHRMKEAVDFAHSSKPIVWGKRAGKLWDSIYAYRFGGKPGLLGAITSRGEAQTWRLATIYALLDCSTFIKEEHLKAALAVWKYSEDSCRFIFGETVGEHLADQILQILRQHKTGLTRKQITDFLHHNKSTVEIERSLELLQKQGVARSEKRKEGPWRPAEYWLAT